MDEEQSRKLIEAVRALPALWDKADKEFKNGKNKPAMWQKIAEDCDFEGRRKATETQPK